MIQESIWNEDCIKGAEQHLADESIDLLICDPPFGIGETKFDGKQYNRKSEFVNSGYVEAPADYQQFTTDWMAQARRVLKKKGVLYVVIGWSREFEVRNAERQLGLHLCNEIIWKYQFGVNARHKYIGSHYSILVYTKSENAVPILNPNCRFADDDRDERNRSRRYPDMEDVWYIPREYQRGKAKHVNKLPDEFVRKIMAYSSKPGYVVCDFFLGSFTTAKIALEMKRIPVGFELGEEPYRRGMAMIDPAFDTQVVA